MLIYYFIVGEKRAKHALLFIREADFILTKSEFYIKKASLLSEASSCVNNRAIPQSYITQAFDTFQ